MLAIKNEVMQIEADWSVNVRTMPIIEGVEVRIFDGYEAVLRINGKDVIEFNWTHEARSMFAEIDTAESIEIFELLARLDLSAKRSR